MATSTTKLNITFQNFENWIFTIQCKLTKQGLWDVCTNEVNAEDANEKKKDREARLKIFEACDASVTSIISSTKTAYELMHRLREERKKRLSLIKKLFSIRYNDNMKEYVNRVSDTQKELHGIGAPLDDGFLAMYMLAGLPEVLEHIVTRLDDPDVQITSEIVVKELLKVGDAVLDTSGAHTQTEGSASAPPPKRARQAEQPVPGPSAARTPTRTSTAAPPLKETHTISSLSPYLDPWTIKVRVTDKSEIQSYNKKKKQGGGKANYFTMDLRDRSGVIRAVAFEAEVDRFYHMIQVGKHYYISRGLVKKTKKKYKQVDNDNEITFSNNTLIAECMDA